MRLDFYSIGTTERDRKRTRVNLLSLSALYCTPLSRTLATRHSHTTRELRHLSTRPRNILTVCDFSPLVACRTHLFSEVNSVRTPGGARSCGAP